VECALEKIDESAYGFSDVDFVLTAELDRLGRHRQVAEDIGDLVDAGVHVILTRDRIDTRDPNNEIIIDFKANMSAGYSRSVSKHVAAKQIDRAKQNLPPVKPPLAIALWSKAGHYKPCTV
jgi:DNA invertase Pin-like site-specific DNA recombinase